MIIHTFGNPSAPVFVILHPPGLSGDYCYQLIRPYLKEDYCIIAPDLRGHGKDETDYISPAEDGKTLLRYLKEKKNLNIRLLFGASIGAAAALRVIQDPELMIDHVYLDSTPLISRSGVKQSVLTAAILKEKRKRHRSATSLKDVNLEKLYGKNLAPIISKSFQHYSEKSLRNISAAFFSNNDIRTFQPDLQKRMVMEWGEDDEVFKQSRRNIKKKFPYARIRIRKGEGHCSYMAKYIGSYIKDVRNSMNS